MNKKVTVKKSSTVLKQQHNAILDLDSDVTELVSTAGEKKDIKGKAMRALQGKVSASQLDQVLKKVVDGKSIVHYIEETFRAKTGKERLGHPFWTPLFRKFKVKFNPDASTQVPPLRCFLPDASSQMPRPICRARDASPPATKKILGFRNGVSCCSVVCCSVPYGIFITIDCAELELAFAKILHASVFAHPPKYFRGKAVGRRHLGGCIWGGCIWEKTSGSREGASGRRHLEGNIWKTSGKKHLGRCIWEKPFGGASGRTLGKALWGSSEVALDTPGVALGNKLSLWL